MSFMGSAWYIPIVGKHMPRVVFPGLGYFSLSMSLSATLCISLSLSLFPLSLCLLRSLCLFLSISPSLCLLPSLSDSLWLSPSPSQPLSIHLCLPQIFPGFQLNYSLFSYSQRARFHMRLYDLEMFLDANIPKRPVFVCLKPPKDTRDTVKYDMLPFSFCHQVTYF